METRCTLADVPRDVLGEILLGPMVDGATQRDEWPPYAFLHDLQDATRDGTVDEARMVLVVLSQSVCREWRDVVQKAVLDRCCAPLDYFSERCIAAGGDDDSLVEWAERHGCPMGGSVWRDAMVGGRFDLAERFIRSGRTGPSISAFSNCLAKVYTEQNAPRMERLICVAGKVDSVSKLRSGVPAVMAQAAIYHCCNPSLLYWATGHPNFAVNGWMPGHMMSLAAKTGNKDVFEHVRAVYGSRREAETHGDAMRFLRQAMMSGNVEFVRYMMDKYQIDTSHLASITLADMGGIPLEMLDYIRSEMPAMDVRSEQFVLRLLENCLNFDIFGTLEERRSYFHSVRQWMANAGLTVPPTHTIALMLSDTPGAMEMYTEISVAGAIMLKAWNTTEYLVSERAAVFLYPEHLATDKLGWSVALCQRLVDAGLRFGVVRGEGGVPKYASLDLVLWLQRHSGGAVPQNLARQMSESCGLKRLGARPQHDVLDDASASSSWS